MNIERHINLVLCLLTALRVSKGHNIGGIISSSNGLHGNDSLETLPEVHGSKFFYFGFGSNMLAQRIHIQNPTAERIGAALLGRLSPGLCAQEGVHLGIYEALTVYVKLQNEETATAARAYMLTKAHQPESNLYHMNPDEVPQDRQPSKTYLQCLIKGAIESSIPEEYVVRLRSIKHNGRVASNLEERLGLQDVFLP
ncbi:GL22703 [Drosophila persimilis]|uniref:gamma-glutamylcyclotransferase n=1 Tax=Drosophila persimilis TaxID=7234 RepID=B4GZW9_DROPE|nr:GL22703 [Drosophila persimilis]